MSQQDAKRANEQRRELEIQQRKRRVLFEDPEFMDGLKQAEQTIKAEGKGKIIIEIDLEEGSTFHTSYTHKGGKQRY